MSYMNYMLGLEENAKDQVDAIHKAVNFCSVCFSLIMLRKVVFKRRPTRSQGIYQHISNFHHSLSQTIVLSLQSEIYCKYL